MSPQVSVIIPIYNAENYVKETIDSVLHQTHKDFELFLVNHNSTDDSLKILKQYEELDKRVKIINLEINKGGPAYPRNEGLKASSGKYVAFVDSDDVWLKNKLEKELDCMNTSGADIVHTLANIIDENSHITGEFKNQRVFNKLKYILSAQNIVYYTNYININSVLIRNTQSIHFSEEKNLIAMEDWKLWMESINNGKKVVLLEEKLLNYRVHSASISNRDSDIGYRKSLHLLSLMLLNKEIPLRHYIFSSLFNIFKIFMKNF